MFAEIMMEDQVEIVERREGWFNPLQVNTGQMQGIENLDNLGSQVVGKGGLSGCGHGEQALADGRAKDMRFKSVLEW